MAGLSRQAFLWLAWENRCYVKIVVLKTDMLYLAEGGNGMRIGKMRFRRGDAAVARHEIRSIAGTIPAGAKVAILSADPILRCYDVSYRGVEITECGDGDLAASQDLLGEIPCALGRE